MRYGKDEQVILVGKFKPGSTVTIKLIELSNDNLVEVTNNICVESDHLPGVYLWSTSDISDDSLVGYSNILYLMSDDTGKEFIGKFVYGGYIDDGVKVDLSEVLKDTKEIKENVDIVNARL